MAVNRCCFCVKIDNGIKIIAFLDLLMGLGAIPRHDWASVAWAMILTGTLLRVWQSDNRRTRRTYFIWFVLNRCLFIARSAVILYGTIVKAMADTDGKEGEQKGAKGMCVELGGAKKPGEDNMLCFD